MKVLPYRVLVQLLYPCCTYIRVDGELKRTVYIPDLSRALKQKPARVRMALRHLLQAALIEGFEEDRNTWTATIKLKEPIR